MSDNTSEWVPAVVAIAHVMRADGCDRATAIGQIEAAVRDGALRRIRQGNDQWGLDAEVFRADLSKLWPNAEGEQQVPVASDDAVGPASTGDSLRAQIAEAVRWHDQPLPPDFELRRLHELIAEFWSSVRQEIRFCEHDRLLDDEMERLCTEAVGDARRAALGWLRQGRLAAFLDTAQGLKVLSYGSYWQDAEGSATPVARQALSKGTAPSCGHPGLVGKVKVRKTEFASLVAEYMSDRGFEIEHRGAGRFAHPVWDLRDVFGWVLDRDPARFGRINSETDWRSAAWAARFYTDMPRIESDRLADQTLLHALQRGELTGYSGTSAIRREFWIDKTEQTLRYCSAHFYHQDVLTLWPDPRMVISRAPPPISSLRGGYAPAAVERAPTMDRSPPWTIWKNVGLLRVFEAVALSLNIDPRKLRQNQHAWMAGKRLFNEDQEFNDRLFLAERNLAEIGVINFVAAHVEGQEPIVRPDSFVRWALRIGWPMPAAFSGNRASQSPELPRASGERTKSDPLRTSQRNLRKLRAQQSGTRLRISLRSTTPTVFRLA